MRDYVIALDQGTSSSRAIVFDRNGYPIAISQKEFTQYFPNPGMVEHDPMEIWSTECAVMAEAMTSRRLKGSDIAAIGITNQRETTIVWDASTGKPIYNAIVWQCRRTASICEKLKEKGLEPYVKEHTGLLIDAYFSGTKIKWILDNVDGARKLAEEYSDSEKTIRRIVKDRKEAKTREASEEVQKKENKCEINHYKLVILQRKYYKKNDK